MAAHVVRPATPGESGLVARLLHDFNTEYRAPTPSVEELTRRLRRLLPRDDVLVLLALPGSAGAGDAGAQSAATGFALLTLRPSVYCDAGVAMLDELYVRPPLRGHGAGTALVEELLEWLRGHGIDEVQVNVDSVDVDARRFYERHGFSDLEPAGPGETGQQSRMLLYQRET